MPNQRFFPEVSQYICIALALAGLCQRADAATACVWRVTNVPVPFYLVGTVHALRGGDYPLPKAYDQALRDSRRLLFEVDPDPKGNYSKKFAEAATYPKGDDIRKHIHPKAWAFLIKNFQISNYDGQS